MLTPKSSFRYKVEFDIVAQANRFGFRGDESTIRTGQIVAIGDSYTFGWGNNLATLGRKSSHLHDPPRSDRRRRLDRAVELSLDDGIPEARADLGCRQHDRYQAVRSGLR